jgi:2-dehydropantoate 2-reductase
MRFVVCGAGAVGGVLGGQLAKAGYEVVFIDKSCPHVEAINRYGLQLKGVHGQHQLAIPAVMQAREVDFRPQDSIILAVKCFQSHAAMAELKQATALELPIFCAQNGVRNEAIAARSFPQVHGMVVLIGAKRLRPGEVVHTGNGPVGVGTYPSGLSPVAEEVAAALEHTDLPIYTTEHIVAAKWNKLLLNLNNATMGVTGLASQEGWASPEARIWMAEVWEEGARVLQAAGIAYEGPPQMGAIEARIAELRQATVALEVPEAEELKGRSSLWQDLYHQRGKVEAAYFNGEIVALGRRHHVPTPYNEVLLERSIAMAAARELPGKYTISQLRARLAERTENSTGL